MYKIRVRITLLHTEAIEHAPFYFQNEEYDSWRKALNSAHSGLENQMSNYAAFSGN